MQNGLGRSVGYGFVELKDHQSALTALRNINNNPTVFGPDKVINPQLFNVIFLKYFLDISGLLLNLL